MPNGWKGFEKTQQCASSSPAVMHWKEALLVFIRRPISQADAAKILNQNTEFVFLRDAFPKGRLHFLVLARSFPKSSIFECGDADAEFLQRMSDFASDSCAKAIASENMQSLQPVEKTFNFGFHAVPSLQPLHMHCISKDLIGAGTKTKQHYNSFASPFFIHVANALDELRKNRTMAGLQMRPEELNGFLKGRLRCVECQTEFSNLQQCKTHRLARHAAEMSLCV